MLVRGSADFTPLTAAGKAHAVRIAKAIAARGGFTCAYQSSALRVRQCVNALVEANPETEPEGPTDDLLSWQLGGLEGSPVLEAQPKILAYMKWLPGEKPAGRSEVTGQPGISFDEFRFSRLSYLAKQFLEWQRNQKLKLLIASHHRVLKLLDAWLAGGMAPLYTVDAARFASIKEIGQPGDMWRVVPGSPAWKLVPFNPYGSGELPPSVYFWRHCQTNQNSGSSSGVTSGRTATHQS